EFLQAQPAKWDKASLSSIVVQTARPEAPVLHLSACYFAGARDRVTRRETDKGHAEVTALAGVDRGGRDAVTVLGKAKVWAHNCAFGPHAALFRLQGSGKRENLELKL